MNIKQFLKPDWRKIIVLIILSYFVGVIMEFPLNWQLPGGGGIFPSGVFWDEASTFKIENLILDLIFCYFLSCLTILIYDKFKKKPQ